MLDDQRGDEVGQPTQCRLSASGGLAVAHQRYYPSTFAKLGPGQRRRPGQIVSIDAEPYLTRWATQAFKLSPS